MKPLKHHLKRWLVAHKKNDHRPKLIRRSGLAIVAAAIIGTQAIGYVTAPATHGAVLAYASDINVSTLFSLTNQQRVANGLPALRLDSRLNTSATLKANDMFANDYWAHVSPSGVQPWYWFGQAGYSYSYAGENLAKDFDTSSGVMDGWMNSSGHRANVLNPHYTDVGFAVENGTLVGGQTTLIVAHYGATAHANVPAAAPAPKSTTLHPATVKTPVPAVVTPEPTPTPTASSPSVKPTSTPSPIGASGSVTQAAPVAAHYQPIAPLAVKRALSPANLITLVLLLLLWIVYLHTHFVVWRKGLKRWRKLHYRLWAGGQIAGLALVAVLLVSTGGGRVG